MLRLRNFSTAISKYLDDFQTLIFQNERRRHLIRSIPLDMVFEILKHLDLGQLAKCARLNKSIYLKLKPLIKFHSDETFKIEHSLFPHQFSHIFYAILACEVGKGDIILIKLKNGDAIKMKLYGLDDYLRPEFIYGKIKHVFKAIEIFNISVIVKKKTSNYRKWLRFWNGDHYIHIYKNHTWYSHRFGPEWKYD